MIILQEHCTTKHQAITGKWLPIQKSRSFLPVCKKMIPTHPYSNDNQMNIFLLENFFQERNRCYKNRTHKIDIKWSVKRERKRERENKEKSLKTFKIDCTTHTQICIVIQNCFAKFFSVFLTHFKSYAHVITCQKQGHSHTAKNEFVFGL